MVYMVVSWPIAERQKWWSRRSASVPCPLCFKENMYLQITISTKNKDCPVLGKTEMHMMCRTPPATAKLGVNLVALPWRRMPYRPVRHVQIPHVCGYPWYTSCNAVQLWGYCVIWMGSVMIRCSNNDRDELLPEPGSAGSSLEKTYPEWKRS